LPEKIEGVRETIDHLHADVATRDAYDGGNTMTLGNQTFNGKGGCRLAGSVTIGGDLTRTRAEFRNGSALLTAFRAVNCSRIVSETQALRE
jgi:hypothetical protein